MLKESLPQNALEPLLQIYNRSWNEASCPHAWRLATIVPIFRGKWKPTDDPTSYRAVALTSSVAKLMERAVATQLYHVLEAGKKFAPCQAGFRKGRSIEEQLARIAQDAFDWLEDKQPKRSVLALLDFKTAYDKVWKKAVVKELDKMGIPKCMIRWIKSFLDEGGLEYAGRLRSAGNGSSGKDCRKPLSLHPYCGSVAPTT